MVAQLALRHHLEGPCAEPAWQPLRGPPPPRPWGWRSVFTSGIASRGGPPRWENPSSTMREGRRLRERRGKLPPPRCPSTPTRRAARRRRAGQAARTARSSRANARTTPSSRHSNSAGPAGIPGAGERRDVDVRHGQPQRKMNQCCRLIGLRHQAARRRGSLCRNRGTCRQRSCGSPVPGSRGAAPRGAAPRAIRILQVPDGAGQIAGVDETQPGLAPDARGALERHRPGCFPHRSSCSPGGRR